MKRLLILAYDFPPYVSVGGLRPYSWYKYLKKYGIYPIVITRQWENHYGNELDYIAPSATKETTIEETELGTIIRTPYKPNLANKILIKYGKNKYSIIRKTISAFYDFTQYIFNIGPKSCIYKGAKEYLKHNSVDTIIATGEPFVLFKYASELSKKHNIPWIADYRDPWTQDNVRSRNTFMKKWNSHFEKKFTQNVKCVTTVSDFFAQKITSLIHKDIHIIANGYDSEAIEKVANIEQKTDKLRFAYVGTIYKYHPLDSVLDCFNQAVINKQIDNFEFNFFGIKDYIGLKNLLNTKYKGLKSYINIFPKAPNEKLLENLAIHNILVLFNDYSIIGTKIFDYLALKRNILFCYKDDKETNQKNPNILTLNTYPQEALIRNYHTGFIITDKKELSIFLPQLFNDFRKNKLTNSKSQIDLNVYSRESQTKILSQIL